MKNYFNFSLTGMKLLYVWLIFLCAFTLPYGYIISKMQVLAETTPPDPTTIFGLFGGMILCILVALCIYFFIGRLIITNIQYKETNLTFDGKFGAFAGKMILGFFLTIITLGIYSPWYIRTLIAFFSDNTSYNGDNFSFKGKGLNLLGIMLATILIPCILLFGIGMIMTKFTMESPILAQLTIQVITYMIMIPYIYLALKWKINLDYKEYNIALHTEAGSSMGKIFVELALSVVTIGLYSPLAGLRLYKYFLEKTAATSEDKSVSFKYEFDEWHEFLFMWGQILLTIVTLSIYYPWAISKIGQRVLSKTYTEEV